MRILPLILFLSASPVLAQGYDIIAYESFDYANGPFGQSSGGDGWSTNWWCGTNLNHALVSSPGFDALGGKATTNWSSILGGGEFGLDDTTVWVAFQFQREPGCDNRYGGLSFFKPGGETFFLGST